MNVFLIISALVVGTLISCRTTATTITGDWKNPAVEEKQYDHILVVALVQNINAKSTVENDLARELREQGVNASTGMEVFPPSLEDGFSDKQSILNYVRNNGAEAILTVSLIDEETESRYVPGTYSYAPYPMYNYYGMFWGYYSYWYPRVYSPGYYTEDKVYYIETNLYDADTERLVWSAQSETYNPSSLDSFSEDFAKLIATRLTEENVL